MATEAKAPRRADCHPDRKHVARGMCAACYQRHKITSNPEYAKRQRKQSRLWAKDNPTRYTDKVKAAQKRWYAINKDEQAKKAFQRRMADPVAYLLKSAKRRAEQEGIPFHLTPADIRIPHVCPVLGITLAFNTGSIASSSPSIDRVVPHLGYVPGNIRVISARANRIKTNATPDELLAVARYAKEATCQVSQLFSSI
jgi:hypothetical protein